LKQTLLIRLFALSLLVALAGCDQLFDSPKEVDIQAPENKLNSAALLTAANLFAYTQMSDALTKAEALDSVIGSFLQHPNPLSLEEAQKAWKTAYEGYLKVSFFDQVPRFEKPQFHENLETYANIKEEIDSWPIEAGYIDYLPMYPLSGIVNDLTLKITHEGIMEQHGFSDARFASLGFHPMEFLLFGADGARSAKDFIPQENDMETVSTDTKQISDTERARLEAEAFEEHAKEHEGEQGSHAAHEAPTVEPQNHNRRREYLRLLSAHVVKNLQKLADRWEPAHGYYAKQWRSPHSTQNIQRVYQASIDVLQDVILNQHLAVLMSQQELDDLRSPFSKQDISNMRAIIQGIEMLYTADLGFMAEIKSREAEVADKLTAQFKRLLRDVKKLPNNLVNDSLSNRQKRLKPVQQRIVQLLEAMYSGAQVLGLELKALPVSTS
jgi:putative iron-regulated protein